MASGGQHAMNATIDDPVGIVHRSLANTKIKPMSGYVPSVPATSRSQKKTLAEKERNRNANWRQDALNSLKPDALSQLQQIPGDSNNELLQHAMAHINSLREATYIHIQI